ERRHRVRASVRPPAAFEKGTALSRDRPRRGLNGVLLALRSQGSIAAEQCIERKPVRGPIEGCGTASAVERGASAPALRAVARELQRERCSRPTYGYACSPDR